MKALQIVSTIITLLYILPLTSDAQNILFTESSKHFRDKYEDQINDGEKIDKSWYHYVTTCTDNNEYFARTFYPDTKQIVSHVQYKSDKYIIKNGYSKFWSEQGVLTSEGYFKNDNRIGLWKHYNRKNGSLSTVGTFRNGKPSGLWTNFENGDTVSIYNYIQGVKEGPFIEFDSLGHTINTGVYKNDSILTQSKVIEKKDTISIETLPLFFNKKCSQEKDEKERKKCAETAMLHYIYRNIKYPPRAREYGLQGKAIAQFVINQNGELEDIDMIVGLCDDIKRQCIELLERMPRWTPGTLNGIPVKVKYTLPVTFRLE